MKLHCARLSCLKVATEFYLSVEQNVFNCDWFSRLVGSVATDDNNKHHLLLSRENVQPRKKQFLLFH